MLVPAIVYKEELEKIFARMAYDEMMSRYLCGTIEHFQLYIQPLDNDRKFQYTVVNDHEELIGYIEYRLDLYDSTAWRWGLMSFKNDPAFSTAVRQILDKLINEIHIRRMTFGVMNDNPVKRHYDRFAKRFNRHYIHEFHDVTKDSGGNYHGYTEYEIFPQEGMHHNEYLRRGRRNELWQV